MKQIFLLLVIVSTCWGLLHKCVHEAVSKGQTLERANVPTAGNLGKRASINPLRVYFDVTAINADDPLRVCTAEGQWRKLGYPGGTEDNHSPACIMDTSTYQAPNNNNNCWFQCTSSDILTNEKKNFILNTVIPDLEVLLSNMLSVDSVVGPLVLPQGQTQCGCNTGTVPVPSSFSNASIGIPNTDLVVFISTRSTAPLGSTIAFACACSADQKHRPISGYINWGPNQINFEPEMYNEQLGVAIHELTHVLGFTSSNFGNYVLKGNSTKHISIAQGHDVEILATPKLVQYARDYFNCSDLQGVEVENGGGPGTVESHWERRILYNEYMVGYSNYYPVVSNFTLNLFEDMDFGYYPNYSLASANQFTWGKGLGCGFVFDRCNERKAPYNCDAINPTADEGCSWDMKRKSRCNIQSYTYNLDPWYQYYSSPIIGGNDDLADYCGFYSYQSDYFGDCTFQNNPINPPRDWYMVDSFGEHYCKSCRCLVATDDTSQIGPSCHNLTCVNGDLKIKIASIWYDCDQDGKTISVKSLEGRITTYRCPKDPTTFCDRHDDIPIYTSWITFLEINPTKGTLGTQVTINVAGLTTDLMVGGSRMILFGDQDLDQSENQALICDNNTISVVALDAPPLSIAITCTLAQPPNSFPFQPANFDKGSSVVSVIVTDSIGRTAVGDSAFIISSASNLSSLMGLTISIILALIC